MSTYMERTTSSNRFTYTGLLSTIGSGVLHGTHGAVLGTGITSPDGGTTTAAGRMIGIGTTATHGIITITTARSGTVIIPDTVITSYTAVYRVENMPLRIRTIRSAAVTQV